MTATRWNPTDRFACQCCGKPAVGGRTHARCSVTAELAAYSDDAEPATDPDEAERLYLAALDETARSRAVTHADLPEPGCEW